MQTLVIGGTGQVGSLVASGLAARGVRVRVMSRSKDKAAGLPEGAELATADLNDPQGAAAAFKGVDAVFMANPVSPTEGNEGLVGAALGREAGVKRFVYMSVHQADAAACLPHFGVKIGIEAAVRSTGAAWTVLRPSNFYQNDVWQKDPVLQHGVYAQPIGDVGLHRVDTRDIADAAVNALTSNGFENRTCALVGPEALTGVRCAEILSKVLGRPVRYAGNDLDAWERAMAGMLPPGMLFDFKLMYAHFQAHGLLATPDEIRDAEAIVGHPLRAYEAYADELKAMWT